MCAYCLKHTGATRFLSWHSLLNSSLYPCALLIHVQVVVEEGSLICPETQRRFPVNKGIPNLLLNEDEC